MQAAERGPVIEILSRFNDIHRDKQIRENFELFRHVVFDMNGDYYVAVPLDAPPRLNPAERENLRVEAQLLANLFASFEREKIFKRTLLPTTGSIQKRLARQGSKFAGSESFRVYKFTNGAWSDIILGAVMGAARRAERNERIARADDDQDSAPSAPAPQTPPPETKSAPNVAARIEPEAVDLDEPLPPEFDPNIRPARPNLAIDPEHAARFGPYASAYRPEPGFAPPQAPRVRRPPPKPDPEADVTVMAANSNVSQTAPSAPPPLPEPRPATIVTLPRHSDSQASFTLRRETATFSVPVSEAVMPDSLKAAMKAFDGRWKELDVANADDLGHDPDAALTRAAVTPIHLDDPLSDDDRAFLRRIAPPAAE
jgi:hypothetical protein